MYRCLLAVGSRRRYTVANIYTAWLTWHAMSLHAEPAENVDEAKTLSK